MKIRLEDQGEDYGTLVVVPGRDDSFEVGGYAERGEIQIRIPLYAPEAQEVINTLQPLASADDEAEGPPEVDLTGAIWRAMDAGLDEAEVRDRVDQAIHTYEPTKQNT
jgi:hypothetical protein